MKTSRRDLLIVAGETLLFMIILVVIWLDEFIDLPHLILGAPPTPYRLQEYLFESALIVIVAAVIITATVIMLRRAARIENFLRVCAWCRKVWVGDRWVSFEEYMVTKHSLRSSHGICEDCMAGMEQKRASLNHEKEKE